MELGGEGLDSLDRLAVKARVEPLQESAQGARGPERLEDLQAVGGELDEVEALGVVDQDALASGHGGETGARLGLRIGDETSGEEVGSGRPGQGMTEGTHGLRMAERQAHRREAVADSEPVVRTALSPTVSYTHLTLPTILRV